MAHALNSIPLLHWSRTWQECGQCQPQLRLSMLDEILCFPPPQWNKYLRRNSTYQTLKFNSSTRSQQIQIQPIRKKPLNLSRVVFSSPTPPKNSSTASTLQHLIMPMCQVLCHKTWSVPFFSCHINRRTMFNSIIAQKDKDGHYSILKSFLSNLLTARIEGAWCFYLSLWSHSCKIPNISWRFSHIINRVLLRHWY